MLFGLFQACLVFVLSSVSSGSALAADPTVTCKMGPNTRRIQIVYAREDNGVRKAPCQVLYLKDTEKPGKIEIIFEAQNTGSLCASKAKSFQDKIQSMGWKCDGDISSTDTPQKKPN